ncbi:MAG: ATP synthase F1 subunit gamma [Bdellovibrionia bacterium]
MASIKDIKKRIGTVKNTQQTTRAMKMVSAAKLRRAQEAILNQRPYAQATRNLIQKLSVDEAVGTHPLVGQPLSAGAREGVSEKLTVLVLVTSDRGLCGGFNSNVIKTAQRWMAAPENRGKPVEFAFVGRRGHDFFKHKGVKVGTYYAEQGGKVNFLKARQLASSLVARYEQGDVESVQFIYNEFKNAVSQRVVVETFLPLMPDSLPSSSASAEGVITDASGFLVKPGAKQVFEQLMTKHFAIQCFRILLESQAGEHGARMSAMENATKNAGEMIQALTLQYNKQRQGGITKELLEIIAGSESQKG